MTDRDDDGYRDEERKYRGGPELPPNGHGGVRIGNREIYDAVMELRVRVQSLEARVDNVLGDNVELGKRVRSMELKMYGVMAGLVGTLGYVVVALSTQGHL